MQQHLSPVLIATCAVFNKQTYMKLPLHYIDSAAVNRMLTGMSGNDFGLPGCRVLFPSTIS